MRVMKRAIITVQGLVQGIGFRPFIYRLATSNCLKGYVKNMGDAGVKIDVSGDEERIQYFLKDLKKKKIPIAVYTNIDVEWLEKSGNYTSFIIDNSDLGREQVKQSLIPPDVSICSDCLSELLDSSDRHYFYPFTCCALCGPRFTTITDIPYDRERTTMIDFPFCDDCNKEFFGPTDRRFNAQTICCPNCGPSMTLYDANGISLNYDNPLEVAAKLLLEGYTVAVKGIGGIHLAIKATEDDPILRLREKRRKPKKPFALISSSLDVIKEFAYISELERKLLTSLSRPIVALKKKHPFSLSKYISPGLHTIGVMLPYSGIHHLLLHYTNIQALIMTSANFPGEPMYIDNDIAFKRLNGIVDYFLLHNRRIYARCDDSVIRVTDTHPMFLRRSRGYVPNPIPLPFSSNLNVVAVGPELTSTAALLKGDKCYLTQHLGDIETPESLLFLRESIDHMANLLRVDQLDTVACDLHPNFLSRRVALEVADEFEADLLEVQHHHAHFAGLMAENNLGVDEEIIAVVCDGFGYGSNGDPWGGEILVGGYNSYQRVGHLEPHPMPGGDLASYRYGRMLQGILYGKVPRERLKSFLLENCLEGYKYGENEIDLVFEQIHKNFNTPLTTSTGRLLDAVSCLLGFSYNRTFEGEGAMRLEAESYGGFHKGSQLPIDITDKKGKMVLKTSPMVIELLNSIDTVPRRNLAYMFQLSLAEGLSKLALRASENNGLTTIGFTGGVAFNEMITRVIRERVEMSGLRFIRHKTVPAGDGGLSLGQTVIAARKAL
jgi:hydrogenase maturation protein HypF